MVFRVSSALNPTTEENASGDEISESASVTSSREYSEVETSSDEDGDENENLDSTLKDEAVSYGSLEKAKNSAEQPENRNSRSYEPRIMQRKVALTKRIPETRMVLSADDDQEDEMCDSDNSTKLEIKKRDAGSARLMLDEEGVSSFCKKDSTDSVEPFENQKMFKNDQKLDSRRVENSPSFEDDMSWEESTQPITTARNEELRLESTSTKGKG